MSKGQHNIHTDSESKLSSSEPEPIARVGILGLGLLGGSLARAFRSKAKVPYIVAMDIDPAAGRQALDDGVIDDFALPSSGFAIFKGLDLVILCTPLPVICEIIPELADLDIGILSDVGSVKSPLMEAIHLPNFIGGHPMAGSERQGYGCSSESLFENAMYVLCIGESCLVTAAALKKFEDLIRIIGATPIHMAAYEHDQRVAAISHLPHVAASALSLLAAKLDDGQLAALAAGGFRDITRIASSDASLWAAITKESTPALIPVLSEYIAILEQVKQELEQGQTKAVEAFFAKGAFYRNQLPVGGRGALDATTSLTIYLEDRPGALGAITQILGEKNINIRNINIRNFRTYEGGQLHLLLGDSAQAVEAYSLLKEAGYECE